MFKTFLLLILFISPVYAQDLKVVVGEAGKAGVEVVLPPNHKTYWRYVGDSGIPPKFDFSASDNLKKCEVYFQTPQTFDDGNGGLSIGYKEKTLFPLICEALDQAKPISLKIKLDYAICEKQCLPAMGEAKATLASQKNEALDKAFKNIPVKKENLIEKITLTDKELTFKVALSDVSEIFVEGETEAWALPFPVKAGDNFSLKFEGVPPKTHLKDKVLKFTILTKTGSFESEFKL